MEISKVYINTHRYDFWLAKICIASIRYWYPKIKIVLIKDLGQGNFDTLITEKYWQVEIFETNKKTFGWGYGKLEPLFEPYQHSFLILDSDTVLTGPILDEVKGLNSDFIVDKESQPDDKFSTLYYNLNRIQEVKIDHKYPGYSFNSGQWFGTSGKLSREDFEISLNWTSPPKPKFPDIIFNGDQAHLNFILHIKDFEQKVKLIRKKIMLWPGEGEANIVDITAIQKKSIEFPYIIHWAGIKGNKISEFPNSQILYFFNDFYYKKIPFLNKFKDLLSNKYLIIERKIKHYLKNH